MQLEANPVAQQFAGRAPGATCQLRPVQLELFGHMRTQFVVAFVASHLRGLFGGLANRRSSNQVNPRQVLFVGGFEILHPRRGHAALLPIGNGRHGQIAQAGDFGGAAKSVNNLGGVLVHASSVRQNVHLWQPFLTFKKLGFPNG